MNHPASETAGADRALPGLAGSILLLYGLSVAQPLLDLLGRNATFFVARSSPASDIVLLGILVGLGPPLVAIAGIALVSRVSLRVARLSHATALFVLTAAFAVQLFDRIPALGSRNGLVSLALALATGAALAVGYTRSGSLRRLMRYGWVLPVASVVIFLAASPAAKLVRGSAAPAVAGVRVERPAPIVMLMLDELPVASLMNREGVVDETLFPNFARLARDGTWFRNTTTVHEFTDKSVPAMLSGRIPDNTWLPTHRDYPSNLFTSLAGAYRMNVAEETTQLCPAEICPRAAVNVAIGRRWRSLLSDVRWIALHVVLPTDWTTDLPRIDDTWGNFSQPRSSSNDAANQAELVRRYRRAVEQGRGALLERWIERIEPGSERFPTLNFAHVFLPHPPWQYFPDGRIYTQSSALPGYVVPTKSWGSNRWLITLGMQRHLLQLQYVDALIGTLIAHLEATEMYEDTVLVVASDHGASFRKDLPRRAVERSSGPDIAFVPFFIKRPGRAGGVSDRPVRTVDIFPTIMDVLGADAGVTDGRSALGAPSPTGPRSIRTNRGTTYPLAAAIHGELRALASEKYSLFAPLGSSIDLFHPRAPVDLVGRRVASIGASGAGSTVVRVDGLAAFEAVGADSPALPALVTGTIVDAKAGSTWLAIALNDRVVSMTQTYQVGGREAFVALLPPQMFRDGANSLQVFIVEGSRNRLRELQVRAAPTPSPRHST